MGAGTGIPNIGSSAIGDPIGKAVVEIIADDKEYQKGLKKSEKSLDLFDKKTQKIARRAGIAFAAGGAAITAALSSVIFQAAKAGDELDKMSLRTGVSVENLSRLSFAAQRSGSDITGLETSLRFLSRNMDEASKGIGRAKDVFEELGISITDQQGALRSQPEVILDVATAISNLESETQQVAAAMDIFGARSGPGLLPLLKQGEEGIQALMDRADELGIVISTEAATASAEFSDRLLEMTASLKMAGFELGQTLLPAAEKAVVAFTGVIAEFNKLDDGTKKVIGYTAAIGGLSALLIGSGLIMISRLSGIAAGIKLLNTTTLGKGFKGTTATLAALAASLFAYKQIMKEARDETDEAEAGFDAAQITLKGFSGAAEDIEKALKDLERFGIDPSTATINDLGISVENLNEKLNEGPGLIDKFFKGFTQENLPQVETIITRTMDANEVLDVLKGRIEGATEASTRFKKELDGAAGGIDDVAGAAGTATEKLTGFQEALTETRENLSFLRLLDTRKMFPREDEPGPEPAERGGIAAAVDEAFEAQRKIKQIGADIDETRAQIGVAAFDQAVIDRGIKAKEAEAEAILDNEARLAIELERLRKIQDAEELDRIARGNELAEQDHQDTLDSQIKAINQEADAKTKAIQDEAKLRADARKNREKEDKIALKKTLDAQAQAAADVLAAWERTADEIKDAFDGLFESVFAKGTADWQTFLNDLERLFQRKMAEFATDQTIGKLLDRLTGTERVGAGGVGGTVQNAAAAKTTGSILDRIFGRVTGAGTTAGAGLTAGEGFALPLGVGATGPVQATAASSPLVAAGPLLPIALPLFALVKQNQQAKARDRDQRSDLRSRLQDMNFSVEEITAAVGRLTDVQNGEHKKTAERAKRLSGRGPLERNVLPQEVSVADLMALGDTLRARGRATTAGAIRSGDLAPPANNNIARMAPGAPGQTVIINVDKLADSMPIVFPDIKRTTPKEIADIASEVVVPAMKTAIKRGIFNRSIES